MTSAAALVRLAQSDVRRLGAPPTSPPSRASLLITSRANPSTARAIPLTSTQPRDVCVSLFGSSGTETMAVRTVTDAEGSRPKFVSLLRAKVRGNSVDSSPKAFTFIRMQPNEARSQSVRTAVVVQCEKRDRTRPATHSSSRESHASSRVRSPDPRAPSNDPHAAAREEQEDRALRRAQIYAINKLMARRAQAAWEAYRSTRGRQMAALDRCCASGATTVAVRGLRRWAERASWKRQHNEYRATLEQRREAQSLRHCIEVMSASPDDAAVVREMPVDGSCGPARIRHCPWQHTAAGCPRLSSCPLSHKPLPPDWQPTWKYRLWALENHEGWTGEASNRKFARVHAL